MSGSTPTGSPPPEVPEEFAAAYRAAYERALADQRDGPRHQATPETEGEPEGEFDEELPRGRGRLAVGTHRTEAFDAVDDDPTWFETVRDSAWFVPLLLGLLALLLVVGAYAVGRRLAGEVSGKDPSATPSLVLDPGGKGAGGQQVTNQQSVAGGWKGAVAPVEGVRAHAGCTSPSGVDAGGNRVEYGAANMTDGVAGTTWRCDGMDLGEKITLDLGREVPVGQVGLIPGYAKTDPQSRADRFAENNRIVRVRWTIGDTKVLQRLSGRPDDRSLQLLRVPRTTTDRVELEILAVARGPRDTTAISEVAVGRAQ